MTAVRVVIDVDAESRNAVVIRVETDPDQEGTSCPQDAQTPAPGRP